MDMQEDDEVAAPQGPLSAFAMEANGPMSIDALTAEARKFVDPDAKKRAMAAGFLKPKQSPHFSESFGNALGAYNAASDKEAELTARYMPIVQRAAEARRQAKLQEQQRAQAALDSFGATTLLDPNLSPDTVKQGLGALVQQGRVPGQMAENYLKSLPQDPTQLRQFLTTRAIAATDPYRAVKTPAVEKYGEGEIGFTVDPVSGERKQVAQGGAKSNDFSRALSELMAMDPKDPRRPMMEAYLNKLMTHPPAASLSVNAEKPLINSFMGELGKSAGAARDGALGAKNSLQTANRLLTALAQPGIITGPGANAEVVIRQVAEWGGYGGKDNRERLNNTRAAIQATAQLELDAAAQMKGQGAITEGERALLARAASGNISMTKTELRTLAEIIKKTSRWRISQYNKYAKKLADLPGLEKMAPLLEVEGDDDTVESFDAEGNPVAAPMPPRR